MERRTLVPSTQSNSLPPILSFLGMKVPMQIELSARLGTTTSSGWMTKGRPLGKKVRMDGIVRKGGGLRNPKGEVDPSGARDDPLPKSVVEASTRDVAIDSLGDRRIGVGIRGASIQ